jgi:hypothetical protein
MSVDSSLYTLTVSSDATGSKILDIYEVDPPLKDNYLLEMSRRGPELVNLDVDSSQDAANKLRARLDVPKGVAGGVSAAISNVREPVLPGIVASSSGQNVADESEFSDLPSLIPAPARPSASAPAPAPAPAPAGEKGLESLLMGDGLLGDSSFPAPAPVKSSSLLPPAAAPAPASSLLVPPAEAGTAADALFAGPAPVEPGPISQEQLDKQRKTQSMLAARGRGALAAQRAAALTSAQPPIKPPRPLPKITVYSNPAVTDPALLAGLKFVLPANVNPGDKVDNIGGNPKISLIVPAGAKGGDSVLLYVPTDDMSNEGSMKTMEVIPAEQAARSAAVRAKTGSILREAVAQHTRKRKEQMAASVPAAAAAAAAAAAPAAVAGLQGSTGPLATVASPKTFGVPKFGGKKRTRKCRKTKKHRVRRVASRRR